MRANPRPNPVVELSRLVTEAWRSFWARRAAVNELAHCDPLQVAGIAQDLGIPAADLFLIASRDKRAADLLYRRLEALRVDPKSDA
jgi:hypothetical protein